MTVHELHAELEKILRDIPEGMDDSTDVHVDTSVGHMNIKSVEIEEPTETHPACIYLKLGA